MGEHAAGVCEVCGRASVVHLTEIRDGVKTSRSLCAEHVPSGLPGVGEAVKWVERMQNASPQEMVAMLRQWLAEAERVFPDAGMREMQVEQLKRMIEMMEGEQEGDEKGS